MNSDFFNVRKNLLNKMHNVETLVIWYIVPVNQEKNRI